MNPDSRTDYEYDIFLCHNGADKDWTEQLGAQIESETIDGLKDSRKLRVFFDKWDIDIGENLIVRINEGLKKSRFVACILSPEFMKAPWPTFEWSHIVAEDPINVRKRLIPVLARKESLDKTETIELCAPFRALNYVDLSDTEKYKQNYPRLIRRIRALPPTRGPGKKPLAVDAASMTEADESDDGSIADEVTDVLLSNLLKVSAWPTQIYSGETTARTASDIFSKVQNSEPFILRDKRIYTFADLSKQETALRSQVSPDTVRVESRNDWLLDDDKARRLMHLLSKCLSGHLSRLAIKSDRKRRYFFRPNKDGSSKSWKNSGDPSREVAARKVNPRTGEIFWVHHAARIQFRRLGQGLFLLIEPTFVFTTDGNEPMDGVAAGKLTVMWGGKQQNDAALRNVVFWAKSMAKTVGIGADRSLLIRIETGGEPIKVNAMPSMTQLSYGIELDHIKVGSLLSKPDKDLQLAAEDVVLSEAEEDELEQQEETA